ncbi:conserved hypothetical protein [Desulforapulum autotrophicum HRM2]|uniref:Cadherin-like domain-containing protein n=1 Tax=Desulforapulum autotrophicum (strain ATCC 43914 / DSM 3382 / VKM B-1955 / HRM2) TaxID=177437 RepID=C0QDZ9_DESAH|nr:choice-of-anchor U domain-containing protein [Desulforapulum autotrophicum]ACN17420.1 conserved hypothetical protein [Desulforapulum autotrophicum HRM2]
MTTLNTSIRFAIIITCALFLIFAGCSSSNNDDDNSAELPPEDNTVAEFIYLGSSYTIDVSSHTSATVNEDSIAVFYPSDVAQENRPAGYDFPDGLISFTIENLNPAGGDTVTVVITFPTVFDADAKYYKVTNAGFEEYGGAVISGNQVTLTLTDNGIGDSDAIAGQITDPGGVAVPVGIGQTIENSQPMITLEQCVNTTTTYSQSRPALTALANGQYLAVWQSYIQDGDRYGIYAQRFDAAGVKLGVETLVNTTTEGMQQIPKAVGLHDGGYVILWLTTNGQFYGPGDLYFQRYNSDGLAVGDETLVGFTLTVGSTNKSIDITGLTGGGFVIAYTIYDHGGGEYVRYGIATQVFNAAGERIIAETIVNASADNHKHLPSVEALSDGGYVVAWQSYSASASLEDATRRIFFQRFDADGQPVGSETPVGTSTVGNQRFPDVAVFAAGGYVVVWEGNDLDGHQFDSDIAIRAQRFSASGEAIGPETQVNPLQNYDKGPVVSSFSDGGYIVAWESNRLWFDNPDDRMDIWARRFNASGSPMEDAFLVNLRTDYVQRTPAVAVLANDSYVVAWESLFTTDNRSEDVYARRLLTTGIAMGDENTSTTVDILPYAFDRDTDDVLSLYDCQIIEGDGSVSLVEGQIVFDPEMYFDYLAQGERTTVTLEIRVTDDSGEINAVSEPAVVDIIITGTNDLPVVTAPVTASATEEDLQFNVNLLENASDPDGDSLSVIALNLESGDATGVTVGTNALNINPADYVSLDEGESNVIEYSYTVFDGFQGVSQTASITITGLDDEPEPGPEDIQVNTCTDGDQRGPSVAVLSGGGYVVAWRSEDQDGDDDGIYFQRYNADGSELGDETLVNTTWEERQWQSEVSGLTDGGFVVTWRHDDGTAADNIYLQRFDASGEKVGSETRVNTTTTNYQSLPDVAGLNGGGYVVMWSSYVFNNSHDVHAQQYNAAGNAVGDETRINTTTENSQTPGGIIPLSDGGYLITWSSRDQDGDGNGVYFQRYDSSGITVDTETRVNTTTVNSQSGADAAALSDGGYVITWTSYEQDGFDGGIYHQRYVADGNTVGFETLVNTTTDNHQDFARVTGLSGGGYVVTWLSAFQDGSEYGVYSQRYGADGKPLGTETQVNTTTEGDQNGCSIAAINGGGYVITWESDGQDGDGYGIYLKQFDSNGEVVTVP